MTLRVGVIGFGRWAPNLARNLSRHAVVSWIADPSEAAQERARDAGYVSIGAARTADFDAIDALAIVSPIATHDAFAQQALDRGLHVLSEKPLATTVRGALGVKHFMRDRVLMVSSPWLYHPAIIRAGEVTGHWTEAVWYRGERTSSDGRDLDPIADLLPHDVGIATTLCRSSVSTVSALIGPAQRVAVVTLTLGSGCLVSLNYGYRDREKRRGFRFGTGGIDVEYDGHQTLSYVGGDGWKHELTSGPEPLDAMCAEFVACIRDGRQPRHGNIAEAIHVAEVIEAAHTSIREQRVVTL